MGYSPGELRVKQESIKELKEKFGTEHPSVEQIIDYFRDISRIEWLGKLSTECDVNKEALILAAEYLEKSLID